MNESRLYNSIRNIFFGLFNKILLIIMSFINRTFFIRYLSIEILGVSGLFSDILMMLSMADLGLNVAMSYSFYEPLAQNNQKKIIRLINFYKRIYSWIAGAVFIIGISITPFLNLIVNTDKEVVNLKFYYILYVLNSVCSYLLVYKSSIITADQKGYIVSEYSIIFSILKQFIQILILIFTKNYILYLIVGIVLLLLQNICISRRVDKLYPYIVGNDLKLNFNEKKEILKNIKSIFIYKVSGILLNGTDNTIISIFIGTIWVGIYSNYNLIINSLNSFIDILYSSVTASIGNIIASESAQKVYNVFRMMQSVSLILTYVTTVCFSLLINDFITWWLGESFTVNNLTVWAVVLNFYLAGVLHPIWSFREATGLYQKTKYIMLICAFLNIILSVLGAQYLGIAGVIFASALSRILTYFWYEPKLLFKDYFCERLYHFYFPMLLNFLLTIISIIFLKKVSELIIIDSLLGILLKSVAVGSFTMLVSIAVYHNTEGYSLLKNKIIKIIDKRS
ncbi:lipopolysaccharide biosynthesis protein [Candidatus Galacturonibacter soehngenii]|uniref:lipopolysaccharide biosynthesis protein n=1 Tax=Candidatus Galacturonatibacter soehngenii TaxID=2307010 RepID=UPI001783CA2C|nr:transporter [Candidatus Galacturonibacter soehngenii]